MIFSVQGLPVRYARVVMNAVLVLNHCVVESNMK